MKKKAVFVGLGIVGAFLIGGIYYSFDPMSIKWMPKCPFKLLTGLDCPACGNQRALHSILHGEISEAFHYNPFFILSLPYLVLLVVSCRTKSGILVKIRGFVQSRIVVSVYVIAICCWWVLRNAFI